MKDIKKGDFSINDYFICIKILIDQLASIGLVYSAKDHIDVIFDGLPAFYDTFVVSSHLDDYPIVEIESLLLVQESRIEKHIRELDSVSPSANLAIHHPGRKFPSSVYRGSSNSPYNNSRPLNSNFNGGRSSFPGNLPQFNGACNSSTPHCYVRGRSQ